MTLLRRKLSLLSYEGDFTSDSAPLIERLVDDLIHTTESYRDVKQSLDQHRLEGSACIAQVKLLVLLRLCSFLQGETFMPILHWHTCLW